MKTKSQRNPLYTAVATMIIVLIVCYIIFLCKEISHETNQEIDITMQIEKLAKGDSIVVSNLVYPVVFSSIKLQLKTPKKLISGDEKIKFGLNEYDWLGHGISGGTYLKEFAMEQEDHLVHYKVSFREEDVDLTNGSYSVEFMKIVRY